MSAEHGFGKNGEVGDDHEERHRLMLFRTQLGILMVERLSPALGANAPPRLQVPFPGAVDEAFSQGESHTGIAGLR